MRRIIFNLYFMANKGKPQPYETFVKQTECKRFSFWGEYKRLFWRFYIKKAGGMENIYSSVEL